MIALAVIVAAIALVLTLGLATLALWFLDRQLTSERERTAELLRLLEAKAAPAEYAAYATPPEDTYDPGRWVFSSDGLVAVPWDGEP